MLFTPMHKVKFTCCKVVNLTTSMNLVSYDFMLDSTEIYWRYIIKRYCNLWENVVKTFW